MTALAGVVNATQECPVQTMQLPPVPSSVVDKFRQEIFTPPGLEPVEVLRPKKKRHACKDPNAPALVLVPGLSMDARGYVRQLPLGAITQLHVLQANNEAVEGESGFGHFARHVEEYIIANKLERRPGGFIIGGSSMGGAVSLAVCLRGRVKPRALIMIGSFGNAAHLPWLWRMAAPLSWILPIDFAKKISGSIVRMIPFLGASVREDVRYLSAERISRTRGYYGRAIMALTRQNQIAAASKLNLPTFVIHGTQDWILPFAAGQELARTIPGAQFDAIDNAGHIFFFSHAEAVNASIAKFISTLPQHTPPKIKVQKAASHRPPKKKYKKEKRRKKAN